MTNENGKRIILHKIQVGSKEDPYWRNWGYSVELDFFDYRISDFCEFCKTESGIFFKTICHCGSAYNITFSKKVFINCSISHANGDTTFYCCEECVEKLTKLIQEQNTDLLNHEILINVIEILKDKTKTHE